MHPPQADNPKRFSAARLAFALLVLLALAELGVRLSGILDFPVYSVDGAIGYIPKPGQQGNFLHIHSWAFNERSMGTSVAWDPSKHPNILLIGNSIIMGGNPFDQKDKVGPLLQQNLGEAYSVWPIAAGGWTNVNEMVYLNRNFDVVQHAHFFVWEFMGGGLSDLSRWRGEYVFPREYPLWGSWYVFRRYVLPHIYAGSLNELPPTGSLKPDNLRNFQDAVANVSRATGLKCPGIFFLYPTKAQYQAALQGQEWLPERPELERIAQADGIKIVDISRQPDWNAALYRKDAVHPTVEGNIMLARILSDAIKEALITKPTLETGSKAH